MHENRIAGLEKRLRNLAKKLDDGWPPAWIEPDVERTTRELDALIGIRDRNAALIIEAPQRAAEEAQRRESRRRLRERIQFTPGQEPTRGTSLPDSTPPTRGA